MTTPSTSYEVRHHDRPARIESLLPPDAKDKDT